MKKWIEEILRKVLGELLGPERLSALAKKVLEKLLEDEAFVKAVARKVAELAEAEKKAETPAAPAAGEPWMPEQPKEG